MAGNDGSNTPTSTDSQEETKKKFLNGWTAELEDLMADWADKAACYRWMHERTSRLFGGRDRMITIPVIILSTLTGSASLSLDSFFPAGSDAELKKYVQSGIGGVSILAGIITTVGNFLRYAQGCEAHHLAAVSWGKFNRLICIEMSLHPNERMDNFNFLKMFRVELDRLIEQSPPIPDSIIKEFNSLFSKAEVKKPEVVGILEHTKVYKDSGARLKRIAAEAALTLHHKKMVLKNIIVEELDHRMRNAAIEEARKIATQILEEQRKLRTGKSSSEPKPSSVELFEKQKEERKRELEKVSNSGKVSELKNKFAMNSSKRAVSFSEEKPTPLNEIVLDLGDSNFNSTNQSGYTTETNVSAYSSPPVEPEDSVNVSFRGIEISLPENNEKK
jgi:hypothetical protein